MARGQKQRPQPTPENLPRTPSATFRGQVPRSQALPAPSWIECIATEKGDSSHSKAGYMSQGLLKYKVLSHTFCVCSHEPRGKGTAGARPAVTGTCPRPHARQQAAKHSQSASLYGSLSSTLSRARCLAFYLKAQFEENEKKKPLKMVGLRPGNRNKSILGNCSLSFPFQITKTDPSSKQNIRLTHRCLKLFSGTRRYK